MINAPEPWDVRGLQRHDASLKQDYIPDWETQWALYHDRARGKINGYLHRVQQGLAGDDYPVEPSILRVLIDTLNVSHRSPPNRWLVRNGERVSERSPDHRAMVRAMSRSAYDQQLRFIARDVTLFDQVVVRCYPSDIKRRVKLVAFSPMSIMRQPDDLGEPETLAADRRFALNIGTAERPTWEFWERGPEGWSMRIFDARGNPLPDEQQPFAETGYRNPYAELPVVLWRLTPSSAPYIPPRSSRSSYAMKLAAFWNEVAASIRWDSHPEVVHEQAPVNDQAGGNGQAIDADEMPDEYGPGIRNLMPPGVTSRVLAIAPNISGVLEAGMSLLRLFLQSESLPTDLFAETPSNASALSLQRQRQPLVERLEDIRPGAVEFERDLFDAYRAVLNLHADDWNEPMISSELELDVELMGPEVVVDLEEQSKVLARDMGLRLISAIDAIASREGISRDAAIKRYARIQSDWKEYPILENREALEAAAEDGQKVTDVNPADGELNPAASVIDMARDARVPD